jgi:hypothetical protein
MRVDLHDGPSPDQGQLEHGIIAKVVLPTKEDEGNDKSHDCTSDNTTVFP